MEKDKLEIILGKEGISRRDALRIGFTALGSLFVPEFLAGCDKGGGGGPPPDNPTPGNNIPQITTTTLSKKAEQGEPYSEIINAKDDDSQDILTYSLTQKPATPNGYSMNVSSNGPRTARLSWQNPNPDVLGFHDIEIEVSDTKDTSRQPLRIEVVNTVDDISGRVLDILNGQPVQDSSLTKIVLEELNGSGRILTFDNINPNYTISPNGDYVLSRVPTGSWRVKISHPDYLTHIAGFIDLTRDGDETGVDFELIPDDLSRFNLAFFDEVARSNSSSTRRWLRIPTVYINRGPAFQSGILPQQQEIDFIVDVFKNNVKDFNKEFSLYGNPTDIGANPPPAAFTANTIVIGTNPPPFGSTGYIIVEWDDYMNGSSSALGSNGIYPPNGDEITSAYILLRTGLTGSQQKYVNIQEAVQVFGARADISGSLPSPSPLYPATSIFDDPQTIDFLAQKDLDLGKILYKRPPGNRSTTEAPDANPDTYRIR